MCSHYFSISIKCCQSIQKQGGFTLLELVIVSTILAVLSLSISHFPAQLLSRARTASTTHSLTSVLYQARQLAISVSSSVTVCPSLDDVTCDTNWSGALVSFVDTNRNSRIDANEKIIYRHYSPSTITVHYTRSTASLRFHPSGRINTNGSFIICPSNGNNRYAHALIINRQGRVREGTDTNGDNIIEGAGNENIRC